MAGFNDTVRDLLYPALTTVREFPRELRLHLAEFTLAHPAARPAAAAAAYAERTHPPAIPFAPSNPSRQPCPSVESTPLRQPAGRGVRHLAHVRARQTFRKMRRR